MGAVTIALMVGFFAFLILRVTAPQMMPLFTDLSVEDFGRHHQGPGAAGHPLRDQERRRHRAGAEGPRHAAAHEARRGRPAQGRRRRLRDFRQVGRARRHQLRAEHQSPARARRRARPHHPRDRPRAGGARASGAAGAAAVLARQGRALGLDRAEGARHARAAAGARHPPSRRHRRQRPEAAARVGGRRDRPAAGRRQRRRRPPAASSADERKVGVRAPPARAGRIDRHLGGRPRPRPRAAHRRFRLQPHHPDLRQVRSRRPRGALEPDPRGKLIGRRRQATARSSVGNELPGASNARPAARSRSATRTARPRKSSTTRFPAPPRPR